MTGGLATVDMPMLNTVFGAVDGYFLKDGYPRLYMHPAGAVSAAHIDASSSYFWLHLVRGVKLDCTGMGRRAAVLRVCLMAAARNLAGEVRRTGVNRCARQFRRAPCCDHRAPLCPPRTSRA